MNTRRTRWNTQCITPAKLSQFGLDLAALLGGLIHFKDLAKLAQQLRRNRGSRASVRGKIPCFFPVSATASRFVNHGRGRIREIRHDSSSSL
jgi:hypothetical protein